MRSATIEVRTIEYDEPKRNDGMSTGLVHFRGSELAAAQSFIVGKTLHGQPLRLPTTQRVPRHIAQRWGVS